MPTKDCVKKIGRNEYKYRTMTMTPALELLSMLTEFVGPAVAPLAKGEISLDAELDPNVIAQAVQGVLAKLGQSESVLAIVNRLNAQGIVAVPGPKGGKALVDLSNHDAADIHFGEHIDELPGWLGFALGSQFGPFFSSFGGGKLVELVKKKAAAKGFGSLSTSADDGQSSASPPTSDAKTGS